MKTFVKQRTNYWMVTIIILAFVSLCAAESERDFPIRAAPFQEVRITGGFWKLRLQATAGTTLPHVLQQCRETGRLSNFEIAAGRMHCILSIASTVRCATAGGKLYARAIPAVVTCVPGSCTTWNLTVRKYTISPASIPRTWLNLMRNGKNGHGMPR